MNLQYSCTKGKDGKLYVFKLNEKGRKVRTTNDNVRHCDTKMIPNCKTLCRNQSPAKKLNTPCLKKKGLFVNKKEVQDYCQHKPKGEYGRKDRQQVADIYNKVLRGELKSSEGEALMNKIRFTTKK
jgi:hypothetical protein